MPEAGSDADNATRKPVRDAEQGESSTPADREKPA
jgi:hypothetical protein